jgi:hypothetical protein
MEGGEWGRSIGAGGDVNGDGLADFIVSGGLSPDVSLFADCPDLTEEYGSGCAGEGGFVPKLQLSGCTKSSGYLSFAITPGTGPSAACC